MIGLKETQNKMKELREQRIAKGFTQMDIALILGWTISKVSKLESGTQEPFYRDIVEYEFALTASKDTFIFGFDREEPARIKGA